MNADATAPASGAAAGLPVGVPEVVVDVEVLVDLAVDATVRSGAPEAGRELVTELEYRGPEAVWQAGLLLLGLLATRPVCGLPEHAGTEHLRHAARSTPDPVTALVLQTQAAHRDGGAMPAREVWSQAPDEHHRAALAQLLVAVCWSLGSETGRLTPAQTVTLIKHLALHGPPSEPTARSH